MLLIQLTVCIGH